MSACQQLHIYKYPVRVSCWEGRGFVRYPPRRIRELQLTEYWKRCTISFTFCCSTNVLYLERAREQLVHHVQKPIWHARYSWLDISFVQTSVLTMPISVILTEYRKLAACDEQGIAEGLASRTRMSSTLKIIIIMYRSTPLPA